MTNNRDNGRPFCVVQFKELPYDSIPDYVCVPHTWIARRATGQKALVAYPKDEDPFVTRHRVKRKEIYNVMWRWYMAIIKYESDTFNDADYWTDKRNCGPIVEEDSRAKDAESTFFLERNLHNINQSLNLSKSISIKRPAISNLIHKKRAKLDEAAQSSMSAVNYHCVEPGCSKSDHYIKTQDNQLMANAQKEETGSAAYDEQSIEQHNQTLSLPVHVDNSIEDTTFDTEDCSQDVEQPYKTNITPQSNPLSTTRTATVTAPKLLSKTEQKCQTQIADIRYVVPVYGKCEQRINEILNNGASTSHHPPNSVYDEHEHCITDIVNNGESNSQHHPNMSTKIKDHLYSHMNGGRKLVQQTVEFQILPMHMDRKLSSVEQQNLWLLPPPRYDPHDSRWTLKYRYITPGQMELMPGSSIYVGIEELEYYKQISNYCKSLAQRLLTEVFHIDALRFCASMIEKAQASNNVGCNVEVRPGLDEHANRTLLNFVRRYGYQRGWNIDIDPILITLDIEIQRLRFGYG